MSQVCDNGHTSTMLGCVVWLTGLSGAGKTTLSNALKARLDSEGIPAVILDGDKLRHGLCSDLGFSAEDRLENVRRVAEVSLLFANAGFVVISALISPREQQRQMAKAIVGDRFFEVYVNAPLEVCERRDPKGLYARARAGQIPSFTGISDPYEPPLNPSLIVDTARASAAACHCSLYEFVRSHVFEDAAVNGIRN
jgi:adenylylsulfate kinase